MAIGFPESDYTPHGYLQNRFDAGPFWGLDAGGPLRSHPPCGYRWLDRGGLIVGLETGASGLSDSGRIVSPYHSSQVQSFRWEVSGVRVTVTFFLAERDVIGCWAQVEGAPADAVLIAAALVPRAERSWDATFAWRVDEAAACAYADPGPWYAAACSHPVRGHAFATDKDLASALMSPTSARTAAVGRSDKPSMLYSALHVPVCAEADDVWFAVARGTSASDAASLARSAIARLPAALNALLEEDARFWSQAPRLSGDWPESWKHSWVYDIETTRMMVNPPAGVFTARWPTWMASHPRVVLAEGTLDMLRHSYADAEAAQEAVLTLFESALEPQVPCMWANGGYNMVASDGSACGTSPAWCLPFHNIHRIFIRNPDLSWLGRLYPHMEAYLDWWLRNRTDSDGWAVYKCTWESGEDCSPRLDPEQTGFADLSRMARPAELQAAIAQSARILTILGEHLGLQEERLSRWDEVFRQYRDRTRALWDPERGHFRDLLPATGKWVEATAEYWGANVTHDALQLIPLMYDVASEEQKARLAEHLPSFNAVPWILWPSWTYVVTEACLAVGRHDVASEMSASIIDRVYAENDRRDLSQFPTPIPGVAREYWPLSLENWSASEAYGWGATTSLLLLRHLIGLDEWADIRHSGFTLRPFLPRWLVSEGKAVQVENLSCRGFRFAIEYRSADGGTEVKLAPAESEEVHVRGAVRHGDSLRFVIPFGHSAEVEVVR
ncbi:MAG: MGH1-like glycoside hydrolase domain-containing protein [Armatimonadota bacterium]